MTEAAMARLDAVLRELGTLVDEGALAQARAWFRAFESSVAARLVQRGGTGEQPGRFGLIGVSAPMRRVYKLIDKFAASELPVVIRGESGTGKELVARALHQYGSRAGRPYVSENCAAIPETLLESILFGHVRGAFTGATRDNPGHFVAADGGTLFLDEVGDMSLAMQVKLLRVLETHELRPVGGSSMRRVNVRIVAASNKNLADLVTRRLFREDLFHRLNVLTIELPPLRERGEDIWLLASFFAARVATELGRNVRLLPAAREPLLAARWPGNVRQLDNEVKRAVALCEGESIGAEAFRLQA